MGQFNEALEDLNAIINTNDADKLIKVNALIKRASIHMQTDKIKDCLEDYDKAAELGSDVSGKEIFIFHLCNKNFYIFKKITTDSLQF